MEFYVSGIAGFVMKRSSCIAADRAGTCWGGSVWGWLSLVAVGLTFVYLVTGCHSARCSMAEEAATVWAEAAAVWVYPQSAVFQDQIERVGRRGLTLVDYHIHIRGGMTPEKSAQRENFSGIRSGILENYGAEWPLNCSESVAAFIDECAAVLVNGRKMPIGIQVNDRDWYEKIDPEVLARLDFVLADSMIMGVNSEGKPQRLWLADMVIDDPEAWMELYMAHNLKILDEPISIFANPTYLPAGIADRYDELWSDERMRQLISKAVANDIALEIQAESPFPSERFLRVAKSLGAKFTFGTNNHDDRVKSIARWFEMIELLDLQPSDMATPVNRTVDIKPAA